MKLDSSFPTFSFAFRSVPREGKEDEEEGN